VSLTAVVIGYGSIGKRHADILNEMDEISSVAVLSCQTGLPYETITSLEDIPILNPDYVVIASNTTQHYMQLKFLDSHLEGRKILVEKPLFDSTAELVIKHNEVFVGYNLRFHPLMLKIRESIFGKKLWNIQVYCGSYLPDWRPGRDYRETSSARREYGGGVLLDLSHELDYVQWLVGSIKLMHLVSEKVSNLEIETDDLLHLLGKSEKGAYINICLNYFARHPLRQILVDGEGISIRADLATNTFSLVKDGKASDYSLPGLERNHSYLTQHRAILEDDRSFVCTYDEGLETMGLIDRIRSYNNQ